ncbi:CAAX farnesyltransferase subunit beta [Intoshia linei]|uniref:Protein farnesyltransferase subunit beta n=1 Tax=Intoshia linei TaxID=1819745 RepID=A0A177B1S1_9BILA|nr:CAAX farnesyltransferase subunit beta [Intoshia linei]
MDRYANHEISKYLFRKKIETETSIMQASSEKNVLFQYKNFLNDSDASNLKLFRATHISYILSHCKNLEGCQTLHSNQTWIHYWLIHSLNILGYSMDYQMKLEFVEKLKCFKCDVGGYAGGPGEFPHLASTYAAVNALASLGIKEALDSIDREALLKFIKECKTEDGSFKMTYYGERDTRAGYCAISVCKLLNIETGDLFDESVINWITSCQTYEGGYSGFPGGVAHGGYTFCSLASLTLLERAEKCNLDNLIKWATFRQMYKEGGFQGRTNKLVDSCYSFWVGSIFRIIQRFLDEDHTYQHCIMDAGASQEYILCCSQDKNGGFKDIPGKMCDFHHTCYALSGLSIAQSVSGIIVGGEINKVEALNELHNISQTSYEALNELHNINQTFYVIIKTHYT